MDTTTAADMDLLAQFGLDELPPGFDKQKLPGYGDEKEDENKAGKEEKRY